MRNSCLCLTPHNVSYLPVRQWSFNVDSFYCVRKLDCDIRIQLPQVSKEHCKIELNENKEVIILCWLNCLNLSCFQKLFLSANEHMTDMIFIDLSLLFKLILTNLSSVNPTRINGQDLNQSEHLKHGDVITIIDRSFRWVRCLLLLI